MKVYPIFEKKDRQKFELFFKTTNTRNYVLFIAGANTGFRIGDLLRLKKEDVKGNFIEMTEQKTGKKRTIKINKKLKAVNKVIGTKDHIRGSIQYSTTNTWNNIKPKKGKGIPIIGISTVKRESKP